jgi:hypothetical protein
MDTHIVIFFLNHSNVQSPHWCEFPIRLRRLTKSKATPTLPRPSADPYFTRRRRREKFGVLPARRRTDAADKIVVKFEILTPNLKIYRKMYKFTNFPEKCKFHEKRQWKKIFNWKF